MSKLSSFAIFATGAVVGAAASWYFAKTKYERIAQEEIDSVKEVFSKRAVSEEETECNDISSKDEEVDMMEYAKELDREGYTDYSNLDDSVTIEKKDMGDPDAEPYVIPPDEFGELDDYSEISLTYYSDHILADDFDDPIEDIPGTVGFDSLTHFGEYEDDSVFVRNDRLKCDYEILLDNRKYADVIKTMPPRMGGFYAEE